ncbi:hypothetical protein LEMLEM_LOCUS20446 [Lemmus lemmus]
MHLKWDHISWLCMQFPLPLFRKPQTRMEVSCLTMGI